MSLSYPIPGQKRPSKAMLREMRDRLQPIVEGVDIVVEAPVLCFSESMARFRPV
jgi:hypothetical protein